MTEPDLSATAERVEALQGEASALEKHGDLGAAIAVYDQLMELAPKRGPMWRSRRADALRRQGKFSEAGADYLHVLGLQETAPNWVQRGVMRLVDAMGKSGQAEAAVELGEKALVHLPEDDRLKATLARIRAELDAGGMPEVLPLPAAKLANCVLVPDRTEILHHVPKGGIMAELGTWQGAYAKEILRICQPDELHIIDLNLSRFPVAETFAAEIEAGVVKLYEGDSHDILMSFADDFFDYVYIDGDHSYRGAARDLAAAGAKTKASGTIGVNDYTYWDARNLEKYGVMEATHEFLLATDWKIHAFALNKLGHNDLLLRQD